MTNRIRSAFVSPRNPQKPLPVEIFTKLGLASSGLPCPVLGDACPAGLLHWRAGVLCGILLLGLLSGSLQILGAAPSNPVSLTLAWNANSETDIASYQVSYGTASGSYSGIVNAGANTSVAVTGLSGGTTYYFVVSALDQAGQISVPSTEISYQVPVVVTAQVSAIPQTGWSLKYVDSQETSGYPATSAFDGKSQTFWHTAFSSGVTPLPHEIQIDLGAVYALAGFHYLPRQDSYTVGNIGQYEFYTSMDGVTWGAATAAGTFANSKAEKEVLFATVSGRYVRLRSLAEVNGGQECNVAELNVLQDLTAVVPAVPAVIAQTGWSLNYVDSQETAGYPATSALDGNSKTFWHTAYSSGVTPLPHEIQIDLGAVYALAGFHYLPRQDSYTVGNIGQYEFYTSMDGTTWGTPAATGTFANTKTEKEVLFATAIGRYVRLRSLSEVNGGQECNVAELNVLGTPAPQVAATFAAWAAAANLSGANTGPLATPQHDGIANLLKYAFRMSASSPDVTVLSPGSGSVGLPYISLDRSGVPAMLRFEYLRLKNSTLIYTPRKSQDLKTWLPLSASTALSVTDVDSQWQRVVIAEPCDPATTVCFGRVEVTLPTP